MDPDEAFGGALPGRLGLRAKMCFEAAVLAKSLRRGESEARQSSVRRLDRGFAGSSALTADSTSCASARAVSYQVSYVLGGEPCCVDLQKLTRRFRGQANGINDLRWVCRLGKLHL